MIRPDWAKWNQTPEDLLRLATQAEPPRTRERFLALFLIATGRSNATRWAEHSNRNDASVLSWVHQYNEQGPDARAYRSTGRRVPLFSRSKPRRSSKRLKPRRPGSTACPVGAGR